MRDGMPERRWSTQKKSSLLLCRLRVPSRCEGENQAPSLVVDAVPNAPGARHLELPLLELLACHRAGCEVAFQPMLPSGPRGVARILQNGVIGIAGGTGCLSRQVFPSARGVSVSKTKLPLARSRRRSYPVPSLCHATDLAAARAHLPRQSDASARHQDHRRKPWRCSSTRREAAREH